MNRLEPLPVFPERATSSERGFTLVELMVALSGGLFLSVMVFALARDSTRFFQREARLASSTLAAMVGFERLKADIERAGYLSTPNIQKDPNVLTPVGGGTPVGLFSLAGLRITGDTPNLTGNAAFALNAGAGQTLTPDQIVLSGSYNVTDEFAISGQLGGLTFCLQANSPSMARLGYLTASGATNKLALLENVFAAGQLLRIRDSAGKLYFGQVATVSASPNPCVTLAAPLPVRSGGATGGLKGFETGSSVNVINLVRYRVMDLRNDAAGPAWQALFDASQGAEGEAARTELVRDQLTPAGTTIPNTTDVVAEYAVDLGFGVVAQLAAGVTGVVPTIVTSEPGDANFGTFFNAAATGDDPQRVRSVRVRLSVRSREPDRATGIAGGFYRFKVSPTLWARVRTFQADVALPNQASVQW
jgi:hypothetical protein